MALADFFDRAAMAASQVLAGQDPKMLADRLQDIIVGVAFSRATAESGEGIALLELLVRILSRLYPRLCFLSGMGADAFSSDLAALATAINPQIEIVEGVQPHVCVSVGEEAPSAGGMTIFCGSAGWVALVSSSSPQSVAKSPNPLGAGASACLAAANVFRFVFLSPNEWYPDQETRLSTFPSMLGEEKGPPIARTDIGEVVIAGVGAIGMSCVWALSKVSLAGRLHLVDPEELELSNLQRYVLCSRGDVGQAKVEIASKFLIDPLHAVLHQEAWDQFTNAKGYSWPRALVALDSAEARCAVQASLPHWIGNAWTQPGDLGVSLHQFEVGACLNCLYLPAGETPSDDVKVATALGVPERVMQVRELLHHHRPAPRDLLELIGARLEVPIETVLQFQEAPLQSLYQRGLCGGVILPRNGPDATKRELHVPLAHQSALAGVLLAAGLVADANNLCPTQTLITRVDVMRPIGGYVTQIATKDPRGICVCQDGDYISAFDKKYATTG